MALGQDQLLVGQHGFGVRHVVHVHKRPGKPRQPGGSLPDPETLPPRRGDQPPRQRGRIAEVVEMVHQVEPNHLADVLGVGVAQPVLSADRPDQRGVPLDDLIPRLLVTASRAGYQFGDGRVITHGATVPSCRSPEAARILSRSLLHDSTLHVER